MNEAMMWMRALVMLMAMSSPSTAQENAPNPLSVNPILRHLHLEKERVSPAPTPNLNVPSMAGRQTIVLRFYGRQPESKERMTVLRVPKEFFARTMGKPVEVFGLNLLVQYPAMVRYVARPNGCLGWCEGQILLSLEMQDAKMTAAVRSVQSRRQEMKQQSEMSDPLISYARVTPPPDYDEAYDVVYNKWKDGSRYQSLYWAFDGEGAAREFVRCHPKNPSPSCQFILSFPDDPYLRITYSLSASYWPERKQVQDSILAFVRGLLDRPPDAGDARSSSSAE